MTMQLAKITVPTAAAVCVPVDLAPESRAMLRPETTPPQFLEALVAAEAYDDAIKLLAHGLPARESVWWSCVSARTIIGEDADELTVAALKAAEAWTYEPTEPNRRAAEAAGLAEGLDHPVKFAALAVFFSGGSLAPPDLPPVPPQPELRGQMVSNAVYLAAMLGDEPADPAARCKLLIAKGVDIANGGWGTDAPRQR